ncbi:MAG: cytochrome c, partial [Steroidobacteraceae bacterium]
RAEFDKLLDDMQAKTAVLAKIAVSGDEAKIKRVFNDTGQACKACHDKFREKAPG